MGLAPRTIHEGAAINGRTMTTAELTRQRSNRVPLAIGALLAAWLSLSALTCAWAQEEPAAPELAVFEVTSPRQGSSWIVVHWDSTAQRHDLLYGEVPPRRRRPRRWQTVPNIGAWDYSAINLKPDTGYQFRVRAHSSAEGEGQAAESDPITVRTLSDEPREFSGLLFWPQRQLATFPDALTYPCIEAYQGKLYVLEAQDDSLWLSRVDPDKLEVEWTRQIAPRIDEPPLSYQCPDMCVLKDKLWITWHVDKGSSNTRRPEDLRQRLMFYDLSGEKEGAAADADAERISAPLEIQPTAAGRGTCYGSVSPYRDGLWVSWTEVWADEKSERRRGALMLAAYEPWRGCLAQAVTWGDCPALLPGRPSINRFEGDLLILFSDQAALETTPDAEPLLCARFDGKRFHDVHTLRKLGRNFNARGVQVYDRFYFVYQSDTYYPAGGGLYYDISLGRLPGRRMSADAVSGLLLAGSPYVTDMKYNSSPDITALGDTLFAVCAKRDDASGFVSMGEDSPASRGFGSYIGKIARTLHEGL